MDENYKVDRIFSYIVTHDTGFAPNPFWGQCSLACCKPTIRRSIGKHWDPSQNYWIVGISPKRLGNELIYIMRVDHCMGFTEYYENHPQKRPDFSKRQEYTCGDNIYKPDNGGYKQLRSCHSLHPFRDSWSVNTNAMKHDLGGKYVLLSDNFIYYGKNTVRIEGYLRELIASRGHRCNFSPIVIKEFERFINNHKLQIRKGTIVEYPQSWRNK